VGLGRDGGDEGVLLMVTFSESLTVGLLNMDVEMGGGLVVMCGTSRMLVL